MSLGPHFDGGELPRGHLNQHGRQLTLLLFSSADLSLAEVTGLDPHPALSGTTIPLMSLIYWGMFAALIWADRQPTSSLKSKNAPAR